MASSNRRQPCRQGSVMTHIIVFIAIWPLCLTQKSLMAGMTAMEAHPELSTVETVVDITTKVNLQELSTDFHKESIIRAELHSTQSDELTTAAELHSTKSDGLTTTAKLHSTQSDGLTTTAKLHSTQSGGLTTTAKLHSTQSDGLTTTAELQSTHSDGLTTTAELNSTQSDGLTTTTELHSSQSDGLTSMAVLHSTQSDELTATAELHRTESDEFTTTVQITTREAEKTSALIIYQSQKYHMKFSGNCAVIIGDEVVENEFKTSVRDGVVGRLGLRVTQPLVVGPVECDSVATIQFTIHNFTQAERIEQKLKELVAMGNFSITIIGLNNTFIAVNVQNMDDTMTTVTISTIPATHKPHSDDSGLTNVILLIVLSVFGGSLLLAALIGSVYAYQNGGKSQTFNLGQPAKVQQVGAEDFTLIKVDSNERYIDGGRLKKTTSAGDDGDPNESATPPLTSRSHQGHEEVLISLHQTPSESASGVDNPCGSTDDGSF